MVLGLLVGTYLIWGKVGQHWEAAGDLNFVTVLWIVPAMGATMLSLIILLMTLMYFRSPNYFQKWFGSLRNLSWLLARAEETGGGEINQFLKVLSMPAEQFKQEVRSHM